MIYKEFARKKQTVPSAQKKIDLKYSGRLVEYKKIYSLPFKTTLDTKPREFQYKLLNNIVFTTKKLFRFKMIQSPLCAFGKTEIESPEHLFFYCNTTKEFWQLFSSWLTRINLTKMSITLQKVLFGVFDAKDDKTILSHLILLAKFYLHKCKLNVIYPCFKVFLAKVKTTYQIERKIAFDNNKLSAHHKKGSKVLPCLT